MEQLFNHGTHHNKNYLINKAKPGIWGTDQEIAAAAHLFDCSIVCFSKYSNRQFCLQHFPPHFISSAQCTSTCNHKTIYLINSSGTHYESAAVTITETQDEEWIRHIWRLQLTASNIQQLYISNSSGTMLSKTWILLYSTQTLPCATLTNEMPVVYTEVKHSLAMM